MILPTLAYIFYTFGGSNLLSFVLWAVIVAAVGGVIIWVCEYLGGPPIRKWVVVIVVLIILIALLDTVGVFGSGDYRAGRAYDVRINR